MSSYIETELGTIPSHWQLIYVKDLIEESILFKPKDGNHGGKHPKGSDFIGNGIPFIMASDVNNGKVNYGNCKYISKELADSLDKGFAVEGDVLLTHKATLGRTAIIGKISTPYIMLTPQVTFYRVADKSKLDNQYLRYYFDSPTFQDTLINHGDSGSTRAYVGITAQQDLPVILPPLSEQKAIASVLSSLDDKIALLHRQNKTLEAMAETLFRQWFVEEADGDWEEVPLSTYAENVRENVKVENLVAFSNYVGLEHIPRKKLTLDSWGTTGSLGSNKSSFKENDILFGKLRSYFHKVVFAPINGVCSTDILVIRPKKNEWFLFCLFWFFNENVIEHSDLGSGGTRMPRTNWEVISGYMVPKPDNQKIIEFDIMVRPTIEKMKENINQIITLEKLRDSILPKLMNGEVRVEI